MVLDCEPNRLPINGRSLGNALKAQTTKLHTASTQGAEGTTAAAAKKDMEALLNGVIGEGVRGEFADYATAEQATMAMGSIVNAMRTAKVISDAQYNAISDALNGAYDATAKDEAYKPTQFVDAFSLGLTYLTPRSSRSRH